MKMKKSGVNPKKILKCLSLTILSAAVIFAVCAGICDKFIPDNISIAAGSQEEIERWLGQKTAAVFNEDDNTDIYTASGGLKLFDAIPIKETAVSVIKDIELIPGGMPFGVKLYSERIVVVDVGDVSSAEGNVSPAREAGIMKMDLISAVNGIAVHEVSELTEMVNKSNGNPMKFTVKRGNEELTLTITPVISEEDGKYKTGMWIRDSTAGIGTVTYLNEKNGRFAGLGHGICDSESGELLPLYRGSVFNVTINGVTRGESGVPGELKGYFSSGKIGKLTGNKECGIYGILAETPSGISDEASMSPMKVALSREVTEGGAEILCTTDENGVGRYKIEISDIDRSGKNIKNFVVTVTDENLLSRTGGIVQGMSGSPILQNGKIVGAVTHVLVNDPTRGYGIFIENMLRSAE